MSSSEMGLKSVTSVVVALGVLAEAAAGAVLTYARNIVAGAPELPSAAVYQWNMLIFAALGGVSSPFIGWSILKNAPIWRIAVEPAVAGLIATVVSIVIAPAVFAVAVPAAIAAAVFRLRRKYAAFSSRVST